MTNQDEILGALCAWRENRSGGVPGMTSVLNVLQNRAAARGTSIYAEAVRPMQFSSMTAKGDPQLTLYPAPDDPQWAVALSLSAQMASGTLQDITQGATMYYSPAGMPEGKAPYWAASMQQTVTVAGQIFFKP